MKQKRKNDISNYVLDELGYSMEVWIDKLIKKYPLEPLNKNSIKTTIYSKKPVYKILFFLLVKEPKIFGLLPYEKQKIIIDTIDDLKYRELTTVSKDIVIKIRVKNA